LIVSITPKAGNGPYGEACPAGITIGLNTQVQVNIAPDANGNGKVAFNTGLGTFQPYIVGSNLGGNNQLEIAGGTLASPLNDAVYALFDSSNGPGNSANGYLNYNDANAVTHACAWWDWQGFHAPASLVAAVATGTGTSNVNAASPEQWHTFTMPSGWTGHARYKLVAEAYMAYIDITMAHTALTAKTNVPMGTLPSYYLPVGGSVTLPLVETNSTALAVPAPSCYIGSGGAVTCYYLDVGTTTVDVHCMYPLN
jgi:hypothetical protein